MLGGYSGSESVSLAPVHVLMMLNKGPQGEGLGCNPTWIPDGVPRGVLLTSHQLKLRVRKERGLRGQSHPGPLEDAQDKGLWSEVREQAAPLQAWSLKGEWPVLGVFGPHWLRCDRGPGE